MKKTIALLFIAFSFFAFGQKSWKTYQLKVADTLKGGVVLSAGALVDVESIQLEANDDAGYKLIIGVDVYKDSTQWAKDQPVRGFKNLKLQYAVTWNQVKNNNVLHGVDVFLGGKMRERYGDENVEILK